MDGVRSIASKEGRRFIPPPPPISPVTSFPFRTRDFVHADANGALVSACRVKIELIGSTGALDALRKSDIEQPGIDAFGFVTAGLDLYDLDRFGNEHPHPFGLRGGIRDLIAAKNRLWFHYYRPQNWAFLAGDRTNQPSSRDHLDPSKRWFPEELERFVPLIDAKDAEIWALAKKLAK
jgi:hypothetical protein